MKVDGYKCDECGVMRGETNHWFVADVEDIAISFWVWDSTNPNDNDRKHLCGQACVQKVLEQWMSNK